MSRSKRILVSIGRIAAGVPIVSTFATGALFLLFGVTWKGRCAGVGTVLLTGVLYLSIGYWSKPWFRSIRVRVYVTTLPPALLLFVLLSCLAPSGRGAADGHVQNCFLGGQHTFRRFSPWNMIPERDQLNVGITLMAPADPYMDSAKGKRLRSLLMPVYEEMERDAAFHELGSVLGTAYRDLLRLEFRTGHYYLFLPHMERGQRVPCLIFLHGMGGNWKSYVWLLSKISTQFPCAVIAPTFGLGNWNKPASAQFVVDVAKEALANNPIDPEEIYLAGYSNGAIAVTRAAIHEPGLFKGLIYLSPVTEDDLFDAPAFLDQYRGRRLLFLHGGRDKRIASSFVQGTVAILKRYGVHADLHVYEQEDHFLLFSQTDAVIAEMAAYVGHDKERSP